MATLEVHKEVRAAIKRTGKEKIVIVPERPKDRVPVDGCEASRVAAEYLNLKTVKATRR